MQSRPIRTGLHLTELGLGTAQFGNLYTASTNEIARQAVDAAWSAGVRYFDTAPHYGVGLAERRLGMALRDKPRDDYVLSTKVGRLLVADPTATGRDPHGFDVPATTRREWDFSRDGVRRSLDESMTRLGVDRIDIAYVHDPDDHYEQAAREAVPALIELRDQGVLGAIGVGMNQSALPARFVAECDIDLVMLAGRYTLVDRSGLDDLLPLADERGVGIVAAGVYNSGLLSTPRADATAKFDYEDAPRDLIDRANAVADVCARFGVTLPEAAIAFPLRHPAVVAVVVGAHDADQVASNVARYETRVPEGLWREIDELSEGAVDVDALVKEKNK